MDTNTRVCCVIASNQSENTHNTVKLEARSGANIH